MEEHYILANKYHLDNGIKIRTMPDKDAIRLEIKQKVIEPLKVWIPKSVCRWDTNLKTGDVHLYIGLWWYKKNEEQFELG